MNKKILAGSIIAAVIIILASLSSVASARTVDSNNLIQNIRNYVRNNVLWVPGQFLVYLFMFIIWLINHPPPI